MIPGEIFNPYRVFVGIFIPNALVRYKGLSPSAKLVYGRLSQYAGEDGKCFPAEDVLADEVGLSKRQVYRLLSELETGKFIICRATGYVFLWHDIFDQKQEASCDKLSQASDISVTTPCHIRHKTVTDMSHAYKVLRDSGRESRKEGPPALRQVDKIAEEKATAAFEEFETQVNRLRTSGAIKLDDKISIAVMVNDLGGKAGVLALCGDELRKKFMPNYMRRELAAFQKNRRAG
jgi:hypothetical protein